jgi:hypothetical protein
MERQQICNLAGGNTFKKHIVSETLLEFYNKIT